jgi:hypothetical protein
MATASTRRALRQRVESLRRRIVRLTELRSLVALPPASDISRRQWSALEPRLGAIEARLLGRLKRASAVHLHRAHSLAEARKLNAALGEIELETSGAFLVFDTFADILTQRSSPELGPLLAGCDVLAWDAMKRGHAALALIEPPLVYCERGFGAAIIREQVPFPDRTPNPLPMIQIPYSRLRDKLLLTSVLHESGHQALVLLGLVDALPRAFRAALDRAGAPAMLSDLFALWSSEIGPDFWSFCMSGPAAAAGLRDLLSLPPAHVLRVSWTDPHPPPYLRVLLGFAMCRQRWGEGTWDDWEREWLALYPLDGVAPAAREALASGKAQLQLLARTLLTARFAALGNRPIASLFDLDLLDPARTRMRARTGRPTIGLSPGAQLATFRAMQDDGILDGDALDALMTRWLVELGRSRDRAPAAQTRFGGERRHAQ